MEKQQLIFITGGARSGKSSFAESYAVDLAKKEKRTLYYLATSKKSDDEMVDRIKRHQEDREQSEMHWKTVEIPLQIGKNIASFSPNSVVLLDCLTILLRSEEHTSELQSRFDLVCRLLLEKKNEKHWDGLVNE